MLIKVITFDQFMLQEDVTIGELTMDRIEWNGKTVTKIEMIFHPDLLI